MKTKMLPGLTGVRFLAALAVLIFHANANGFNIGGALGDLISYGQHGVPFFFMLSGFILAHNYLAVDPSSRPKDVKGFYRARFARIYPVYALCFLIATPLFLQHFRDASPYGVGKSVALAAPMVLGMVYTYIPTPFAIGSAGWWNGPSWSLCVEALFYALFPFTSRAFMRRQPWQAALVVILCFFSTILIQRGIIFAATSLTSSGLLHLSESRIGLFAAHHPLTTLPLLYAGVALYPLYLHWIVDGKAPRILFSSGLLGAVWLLVFAGGALNFFGGFDYFKPVVEIVMAWTILCLARDDSAAVRFLGSRPMLRLGEASYSLYLIHSPFLAMGHLGYLKVSQAIPQQIWALASIAAAIAASLLLYSYFEVPIRKKIIHRKPLVNSVANIQ